MTEKEIVSHITERYRIVNKAIIDSATESDIPIEYHALIKLIVWEAIDNYSSYYDTN
jgi:hypothetical protein